MEPDAPRFYPGLGPPAAGPLARYLPPVPPGMVSGWLAEHVPPGSWVLDPLGASPAAALEAARAGYRVLVACNNPVLRFMIETLAGAPLRATFQAALAELASARRGEERLEKHLQGLYLTECAVCGAEVEAQAFLWRKNEPQPFARQYHCPQCGDGGGGSREITPADLERLAAMGGDKLQRARALQRVLLNDEAHRADVEEALENYLSRPLYVLFTLINKVEGLGLPPERLRLLRALLISAFDAGSALWPWPGGRSRPRQLGVPPQFRENNLWAALEAAVDEWIQPGQPPVAVTHWPELPPEDAARGGICLFGGRVKALMPLPEAIRLGALLAVFPRPSQAFWTLSVLWTGWLWGAEAALPLRNVLDRRRYDWNWHTAAIHSALSAAGSNLPEGTPFFGLLPELAPGFLSAALAAAEGAGFRLEGLALRADALRRGEQELAQATWTSTAAEKQPAERPGDGQAGSAEMERAAREAIQADLAARGEPAAYLALYAAGLQALARTGCLPRRLSAVPGDLLTRVQAVMARTFSDRSLLRLYRRSPARGGESEPESGLEDASPTSGVWWLNQPPPFTGESEAELPLADRVEMETVRFMQKRLTAGPEPFTFAELDQALTAQFRGLLTPPEELLMACLESYGEQVPGSSPEAWRMRASESAAARRADLQEMRAAIEATGARLGFTTREQGSALVWERPDSAETWWFFRMASSILSRYVLAPPPGSVPERRLLVLPGSRARLLGFKLQRDPRLVEALRGWRFIKFRHLREIAAQPDLRMEDWEPLLDEDPLTGEAAQMALF